MTAMQALYSVSNDASRNGDGWQPHWQRWGKGWSWSEGKGARQDQWWDGNWRWYEHWDNKFPKGGKGWKGKHETKGGKGSKGGKPSLWPFNAGDLIAEEDIDRRRPGSCLRGMFQTVNENVVVAIKPAFLHHELLVMKRLAAIDPLPGVVPVLAAQHPSPYGDVSVQQLGSHGNMEAILQKLWLSNKQILGIIAGIAEGLSSLHDKQIIHCDVKPDNVVLHVRGAGSVCLWLIDFGDARLLDDTSTWHKPGPGAPEVSCWPDVRSGQYSSYTDSWCLAQCAEWLRLGGPHYLKNPAQFDHSMPLSPQLQQCLQWESSARPKASEIANHACTALQEVGSDVEDVMQDLLHTLRAAM